MLREDAESVLTANGYTIRTHYNEKLDRWTAYLNGPDGKSDLKTPTGNGPSEHVAVIDVFNSWSGYAAIRKYKENYG